MFEVCVAYPTGIGFFAGVRPFVNVQMAGLDESGSTLSTHVRFMTFVDSHVNSETNKASIISPILPK